MKKYFKLLTALFAFIVYIFTLAPTVIHLDAGELATVQATLGIAHPTGYPLFTVVGYILSLILFPFSKIVALNLLAAFYVAGSIYFVTASSYLILNHLEFPKPKKKKSKETNKFLLSEESKILISVVTGLCAAFSETIWFQSTSVEVYSLHLILITAITYFVLKVFYYEDKKYWYVISVLLALSFANHMTTILIIPALTFIFFKVNGLKKSSFVLSGKMLALFFPIVIILYLYLPIRAMTDPILNWGNPIDFEHFFRHFTGKQYQVWFFSSTEAAKKQFSYFITTLPQELGYIGLLTSIIGFIVLLKYAKSTALFFLIALISTVLYSINYDIADIDAYFLLAYVSLIFFSIGFFLLAIQKLNGKVIYSLFLIPIIFLIVNFTKVSQSNVYTFEDYTKAILDKTEKNSIVFSYLWDYFVSPSYYFQYVENYRKDVHVIDKELLRRSWYFNQLENDMPDVVDGAKPEIDQFLKSLMPFEREERYNAQKIETNFRAMMTSLVLTNIDEREFYITPEIFENEMRRGEFSLPKGYKVIPMELSLKVVQDTVKYVDANPLDIKIRFNNLEDKYQLQVRRLVSNMLIYRIFYEIQSQKLEKAHLILDKLKSDYPEVNIPQPILKELSNYE